MLCCHGYTGNRDVGGVAGRGGKSPSGLESLTPILPAHPEEIMDNELCSMVQQNPVPL